MELISFASGLPPANTELLTALREAEGRACAVLRKGRAAGAAQADAHGYRPLRERLCGRLAERGLSAEPDRLLLTRGPLQALELYAGTMAARGGAVLVERPACAQSLELLRSCGFGLAAAETDGAGMDPEAAESLLKRIKPAFILTSPTAGSPTGRIWSLERRLALLALARRYGVPIVEDDSYGALAFEAAAACPTLFELDGGQGTVLYLGGFPRAVTPGLRTGWALGGGRLIRRMARAAHGRRDMRAQLTADFLLREYALDDRIRKLAALYRARMEALHALLLANRRGGMRWAVPDGGLFLWLELPEALDAEALLRNALTMGVSFAPGAPFFASMPRRNTARLNYAAVRGDDMEAGVRRLVEAADAFLARACGD